MKESYDDIREKLGEPEWFDEHGVPRYCDFAPNRVDVYARFVALVQISCQSCGQPFLVASTLRNDRPVSFPTSAGPNHLHYGDPPRHDCVGDTMNCETQRIVEFWRRDGEWRHWRRDRDLEIDYRVTVHAHAD